MAKAKELRDQTIEELKAVYRRLVERIVSDAKRNESHAQNRTVSFSPRQKERQSACDDNFA